MNKTTKNSLIAIAIIVIVFALIALLYQYFTVAPISANFIENTSNLLQNSSNTQNENIKNKNNQDYSIENNIIENGTQLTDKEQKAINLAKAEWIKKNENTDGLQFNASVQSDGKYLITVYDIKTTKLIKGYVVDVNTEIINEK